MYLYIISRDLYPSVYTNAPCMQAYKVLDRITGHIEECNVPMTFELDPM